MEFVKKKRNPYIRRDNPYEHTNCQSKDYESVKKLQIHNLYQFYRRTILKLSILCWCTSNLTGAQSNCLEVDNKIIVQNEKMQLK